KFRELVGEVFQELLASFGKRAWMFCQCYRDLLAKTGKRLLKNFPNQLPEFLSRTLLRSSNEVLLLADGVRFRQPFTEFLVDVGGTHESEIVNVISRRDCLDGSKSEAVESASQYKVAIEPILP